METSDALDQNSQEGDKQMLTVAIPVHLLQKHGSVGLYEVSFLFG
jgi:hypothetical protein